MATTKTEKQECLNPNTGRSMYIDKTIYTLVSKAIYHTLKPGKALTYTQIAEGVHNCFKKQKTNFTGSVEWYAIQIFGY